MKHVSLNKLHDCTQPYFIDVTATVTVVSGDVFLLHSYNPEAFFSAVLGAKPYKAMIPEIP